MDAKNQGPQEILGRTKHNRIGPYRPSRRHINDIIRLNPTDRPSRNPAILKVAPLAVRKCVLVLVIRCCTITIRASWHCDDKTAAAANVDPALLSSQQTSPPPPLLSSFHDENTTFTTRTPLSHSILSPQLSQMKGYFLMNYCCGSPNKSRYPEAIFVSDKSGGPAGTRSLLQRPLHCFFSLGFVRRQVGDSRWQSSQCTLRQQLTHTWAWTIGLVFRQWWEF